MSGLSSRVGRVERTFGRERGPCPPCESRARKAAEPERDFGLEWTQRSAGTFDASCPRCGAHFAVEVACVERHEAA